MSVRDGHAVPAAVSAQVTAGAALSSGRPTRGRSSVSDIAPGREMVAAGLIPETGGRVGFARMLTLTGEAPRSKARTDTGYC